MHAHIAASLFCFPYRFFSIPYTLSTTIISISLSLLLVLLAPVNLCELRNYYLVLSFLLIYSSSGLSTDVFPNKTNINKLNECIHFNVMLMFVHICFHECFQTCLCTCLYIHILMWSVNDCLYATVSLKDLRLVASHGEWLC